MTLECFHKDQGDCSGKVQTYLFWWPDTSAMDLCEEHIEKLRIFRKTFKEKIGNTPQSSQNRSGLVGERKSADAASKRKELNQNEPKTKAKKKTL